MEEAVIKHANRLSIENKAKFIEYLKIYNSKDMEEVIERRKKMGVKNFYATGVSFQSFLMNFFDTEGALNQLNNDSQSHST
jgi:hypothetical protein